MEDKIIKRNLSEDDKAALKEFINKALKLYKPDEPLVDEVLCNEEFPEELFMDEENKDFVLNNTYSFKSINGTLLLITYNLEENVEERAMDYMYPPTEYVYYYGYVKQNEELIKQVYAIAIYDENVKIGENEIVYDVGSLKVRYDALYLVDEKYSKLLELKKELKEKHNTSLKIFN